MQANKILFLAALLCAAPFAAHADPMPQLSVVGTIDSDGPSPALQDNQLTVDMTEATATLDARAFNGEVHIVSPYHVEKTDGASAYVFNENAASLTYAYGGTLQFWNVGTGTADWGTGAMFASRTDGGAYTSVARGSRSVAENRRTDIGVAMQSAYGAQDYVINAGHIASAYGAQAYVQNTNATARLDNAYGAQVVVDNAGIVGAAYGVRIETYNSGSAFTSWRGLYIAQPTGPAPTGLNYPIYSAATGTSYFAGDIRAAGNATGLQAQLNALTAAFNAYVAAHP